MRRRTIGVLYVLASAVFFALATVGAKYATRDGGASAAHVTMARFAIGLAIAAPMAIRDRTTLRPRDPFWVAMRAIGNVAAVLFFFFGIQYTTVTKANLLNMTYPIFVFVLSPFITRERAKPVNLVFLLITMLGAWFVVRPENLRSFSDFALGDLLAFSSALLAGFSIAALRRARATDSSRTIVFYVMALGFITNIGFVAGIPLPSPSYLLIAAAAGLAGTLGQYTLTFGFAYVSAQTGALISTIRILIAVTLGAVLFGDALTTGTLIGGVLIVGSLVATSLLGATNATGSESRASRTPNSRKNERS